MNIILKRLLNAVFLILPFCVVFSQEIALEPSIERGAKLYRKNCALCHSKKGTGKGQRIPPLAQSDFLLNNRTKSIRAIKFGIQGKLIVNGIEYDKEMAAVALNDQEIAEVMNYILTSWGNTSTSMVTENEVKSVNKN